MKDKFNKLAFLEKGGKNMAIFIILLGVIFVALSAVLIPYGFKLLNEEIEIKQKNNSRPELNIKLITENDKIILGIKTTKNLLTFGIDMPVVGKVTDIVDNNSSTDAILKSKKIVGANNKYSINNVEILLESVSTTHVLNYVIYFEPVKGIIGPDCYKIFYTWLFSGTSLREDKWFSISTGKEIQAPSIMIRGVELSTDIKKEFPNKIKKTELK